MVGLPGAGKSFFAEHFSRTFSAPLISWDSIRGELFNEPTYSKDEELIVKRVADHMLGELIKTGATVLYEGDVLTQVSRKNIEKQIRSAGYEPLFVWVQTDAATTKSRAMKQQMPVAAYETSAKKFTPLKEADNYIVISGKHTYASQLKIVLRRLSEERAAAVADIPSRSEGARAASTGHRVQVQ